MGGRIIFGMLIELRIRRVGGALYGGRINRILQYSDSFVSSARVLY